MKKKTNTSNDIIVMQDIIDNLNDKNRILNDRIGCLEEQLETAYSAYSELTEKIKNNKDYRTLSKINCLLLVIMGLAQNYCNDGSDLGMSLGKAIENFYADTALSLVKKVDFRLNGRENDEDANDNDDDWENDGEEGF